MATEPFSVPALSIPSTGRAPARKAIACSTTCSTTSRTSASARSGSRFPDDVRARFRADVPTAPGDLAAVHDEFMRDILPYATGNVHPGFMGWVHGGGNVPRHAGGDAGRRAERQSRRPRPHADRGRAADRRSGCAQLFGFPDDRERAVRHRHLDGQSHRRAGRAHARAWASTCAATASPRAGKRLDRLRLGGGAWLHRQAMDLSGLGTEALHVIPDRRTAIKSISPRSRRAIAQDRAAGLTPFLVVGTAGTVDIGAIDDLAALAAIARARAALVPRRRRLRRARHPGAGHRAAARRHRAADSIAFDFHKWGQVPYDAGFILVRDGALHRDTFASPAAYLRRETRGLAAGSPWPCDFGPDLSRGFRALKTWFTLKVYGTEALGAVIVAQLRARALSRERDRHRRRELELLAPVAAQHRLLPLSRRRCRPAQRRDRRRPAGIRHRRAVDDDDRRPRSRSARRSSTTAPSRATSTPWSRRFCASAPGRDRKLRRVRRGDCHEFTL